MKEIEHLKSMWKHKIRRKTKLIVPSITYENMIGWFDNEFWEYKVTYAYRDALDIKHEQRMKDKKPYMVWTQGPIINFKDGDLLTNREETKSVQVMFSQPMGWDVNKNEMFKGIVNYDMFEIKNNKYKKLNTNTCNQMEFLEMLIYGKNC